MYITGTTLNNSPVTIDITYIADLVVPVWYDLAQFNAGGMTIVDSSGNRHNGRIHNDLNHESLTVDTRSGGGMFVSGTQWIESPYTLSPDFTVSMAFRYDSNVNNFPSTLWGSETWDSNKGYLASFTDANTLSFGLAGDLGGYPSTNAVQVTWTRDNLPTLVDFVKQGTVFSIYLNGVLANQLDFGTEGTYSDVSTNFASRHLNDGSYGIADAMAGSIYDIKIRNYGISDAESDLFFQGLRSRYGL